MTDTVNKNLTVKLEQLTLDTEEGILESEHKKWGLALKDVYKIGLNFYKEKEGKALHLTYEDKLKLVAFTQQTAHGPFDEKTAPPLGVLDVIGRDRRAAWLALGNMSQAHAMAGFVHLMDRLCPLFKTYVEAIQTDNEAQYIKKKRLEEQEKAKSDLQSRLEAEKQKQLSPKLSEEDQVKRIKEALNSQTYEQFLQYAQQQYPGNYDQQALLIRQLQDQHYHQYMQQLAIKQRLHQSQETEQSTQHNKQDTTDKQTDANANSRDANEGTDGDIGDEYIDKKFRDEFDRGDGEQTNPVDCDEHDESDPDDDGLGLPALEEARMWTRADVMSFKEGVRAERAGAILTVPHGDAITIRVPTPHTANTFYWEFATDHYDIGFGVYFEWSRAPSSEVTVHLSGSDDDEEDEEGEEAYNPGSDLEGGGEPMERLKLKASRPAISSIVPIFRRDSHLEVYAGSHCHGGEGVYLLKFDNTYSLWRSKTLYYRVYYSQ